MSFEVFNLPWPPSTNNLYATIRGRRVKTAAGRRYADQVGAEVLVQKVPRHSLTGPLFLKLFLYPPREHNVGDIANREKALVDALVTAGVIEDDKFIYDLRIVRSQPSPPNGYVGVAVGKLAEMQS